jgi:hypothetical protein
MPFEAKFLLFGVTVVAALWWLARNPGSRIARIAFSWHGPIPQHGETKSHFYGRQCLFALGWFAQFTVAWCVSFGLVWIWPAIDNAEWFLVVFAFALPLATGMALLGAVLAGLCSVKAAVLGPNPAFVHVAEGSEG